MSSQSILLTGATTLLMTMQGFALAIPIPEDTPINTTAQQGPTLQFAGPRVNGTSHDSVVDNTLGSYSDPGLQAEMAAVGLKPARPDKCTSLYVTDSGFIA